MKTYYDVLGITRTASAQEIKFAFRKIARDNHPDTHPGDIASETRFKEANEAYEVLSSDEKRKQYDCKLQQNTTSKKAKSAPTYGAPDLSNMNFSSMFDDMFADMTGAQEEKKSTKKDEDPINVDDLFAKFMGFKP